MHGTGYAALLSGVLLLASTAQAADGKVEPSWDGCRTLVEQFERIDTKNTEATVKIRAESLLHKGERLCGRDRYRDGMEAMREAIETVGGKPSI